MSLNSLPALTLRAWKEFLKRQLRLRPTKLSGTVLGDLLDLLGLHLYSSVSFCASHFAVDPVSVTEADATSGWSVGSSLETASGQLSVNSSKLLPVTASGLVCLNSC